MDYANIILEMLDRIKILEQEVAALKSKQGNMTAITQSKPNGLISETRFEPNAQISIGNKRDTTRYLFEGNVYLKNRLVLAVIKAYVREYPNTTRLKLKNVFDKSLQGSIGVVENIETAPTIRFDYQVRFFTRESDVIHLLDGDMFVCTQWGIGNVPRFLGRAKELGFKIEAIK